MAITPPDQAYRSAVLQRGGFAVVVIALGLGLRLYGRGVGVPALIVKFGGSLLWGTMVFFVIAALIAQLSRTRLAALAFMVATAVEVFKLVHAPWLDGFRLTLAGALLLGRVFSPWDILAYAAGIVLGAGIDWLRPSLRAKRINPELHP